MIMMNPFIVLWINNVSIMYIYNIYLKKKSTVTKNKVKSIIKLGGCVEFTDVHILS
jgi:hypothetical protein